MEPIGFVEHEIEVLPRHWSVSQLEGKLVIRKQYLTGIRDIKAGQRIVVLFLFHESSLFRPDLLLQKPPHLEDKMGVFSTCSPVRPNPIGLSVLLVLGVSDNIVCVKGIDMLNKTPILDIKPYIAP